jgi:hypothetical protein
VNLDGVLEVSNIVVNINSTLWCTEKNGATVWGPLDNLELNFEFFAPKASSLDRAYDNCAIFVDNSNFFTVWCPAHIRDNTLVSVVDHFFKPVLLVHHPNNNETLFITGGKLLVLVIPLDDNNIALVALQVLVHAQVAASLAFA